MTSLPNLPNIFKDLVSSINIDNTLNKCNKKCKLTYYFKDSGIVARNMGTHILIEFDDKETECAEYSAPDTLICRNGGVSKLVVKEIRIYVPSMHTYKNESIPGELFIVLNNTQGGRNLIISLPITNSHGTIPYASSVISEVVTFLGTNGNSEGEGGNVKGMSVDLNRFIPKNTGYYSYVGHLPWIAETAAQSLNSENISSLNSENISSLNSENISSLNSENISSLNSETISNLRFNNIFNDTVLTCYDIIVYDIKDAAIYLGNDKIEKINTLVPFYGVNNSLTKKAKELLITYYIIKEYNKRGELNGIFKPNTKKFDNGVTPVQKSKLAYNDKGATYFKNDEIWIDCAPTGSEGNNLVIYKKPDNLPGVIFTQYFHIAFLIFVTILSTVIIVAIFKYGPSLLTNAKKPAAAAVAAGKAAAPKPPGKAAAPKPPGH
jgi:carbonic anhydrase